MSKMTTATIRRSGSGFGLLQIAITILVAVTALVHLYLGITMVTALMGPPAQATVVGTTMTAILGVLFFCNFGGYVALNVALYLPMLRRFQHITRALLMCYTAVTFVAYFAVQQVHALNPIGLSDKAVEAALMVLLVIETRRVRD